MRRVALQMQTGGTMKIFVTCSKSFYKEIPTVTKKLTDLGHEVIPPTLYGDAEAEKRAAATNQLETFKRSTYAKGRKNIAAADAVLCMNFEKAGIANYVGSGMFIEIYDAFMAGKKVFLYNYAPEGPFYEEISSFNPIYLKRRMSNIDKY